MQEGMPVWSMGTKQANVANGKNDFSTNLGQIASGYLTFCIYETVYIDTYTSKETLSVRYSQEQLFGSNSAYTLNTVTLLQFHRTAVIHLQS